ncbi:MAG: hypothetical protein Fur0018_01030 [Anaerolineales bacterium]
MLVKENLDELVAYVGEYPVLSVYLNTDSLAGNDESALLRLRTLLKGVEMPADEQAVLQYLIQEHDGRGRSVVMFSCAAESFWRAYPLSLPILDRVWVHQQPYVKPLARLFDRYGHYGVALVDQQGARLFSFHLGTLQAQEGVLGENIHRTKRGGASQMVGRRGGASGQTDRTSELTERNMRAAAEAADAFFAHHHVRRVLLAGTEKNVALFRSLLPKAWQSLIAGTFPMSMTASAEEVLSQAMRLVQIQDRQEEAERVQAAITAAAKGRDGVVGLDQALEAARSGQVYALLVSENYRASGRACQGCGYATTQALPQCPFCGNAFASLPDAVEYAVRQVMRSGGEVEIVHDLPALEAAGHVAALLRY